MVQEDEFVSAAVVPIDGPLEGSQSSGVDPWQMLAEGTGALVSWRPAGVGDGSTGWGPVLRGSSSFSKQLLAVAERSGGGDVVKAGATLFRLELPTGQILRDLVPAVGGGVRGMVRSADGAKISAHARLFPVSGAAVGTGLALGPLVGLMALSVGAEMIAARQQEEMLKAIRESVRGIERHLQQELDARLKTAEHALQEANAAILDQVSMPQSIGLSAAVTGLRDVRHQAIGWLEQWEKGAAELPADTTDLDYAKAKGILDAGIGGSAGFVAHVELLYRAVSLDARAAVLGASEAALANPGLTLSNIEGVLRSRLAENAAVLERLRAVLLRLAEYRITVGTLSRPGTSDGAARMDGLLARLAHALVRAPDVPAVLTSSNRQVLEAVRNVDGSVRLRAPRLAAAS
jgi:hypothetical protein